MDLRDLAVLVEAVQGGSLAEAARRLGLTPMAASRRLAALERELGVRLVHRTTRALAPTPEGEAFLPWAEAMLEQEAGAREALRPAGAGVSGLLRLTCSAPFGRRVVAPLMPGFLAAHPGLRVDLAMTDSVLDIVGAGIDLAIRIAPLRDSTLVARRLGDSARVLVAAPEYLARAGAPRRIADLGRHACLVSSGATHWDFTGPGGRVRQPVRGPFSATALEALHAACLGGLGIANLSEWYVEEELAAGRLIPLPLEDAVPEALGIWAVTPTARMVPPKVRAFLAALSARLAEGAR
ncbi:LysR family transcriptional regulator [Oceanicella sp. SM1341]|uniref:LysR family transcriptional regulator n=1 Tax=Oceanicella sp. SM1341 TaxID=1548889 RepID=UPI000E497131|nr:LysR family transcriptional regulator [Oceanicella sp. SM1341]